MGQSRQRQISGASFQRSPRCNRRAAHAWSALHWRAAGRRAIHYLHRISGPRSSMIPNMYKIAGELSRFVHARDCAGHWRLTLFRYLRRSFGRRWPAVRPALRCSAQKTPVQEAHDMAAYCTTRRRSSREYRSFISSMAFAPHARGRRRSRKSATKTYAALSRKKRFTLIDEQHSLLTGRYFVAPRRTLMCSSRRAKLRTSYYDAIPER